MEDTICQYWKFGYCRYKSGCKRKHLKEECEYLDKCNNIKICKKRHPKRCNKYDSGKCKFEECAYKHQKPTENADHELLKQKVEMLEKVLHAMTRKVLSLETKVEKVEKKSNEKEKDEVKIDNKNECQKEVDIETQYFKITEDNKKVSKLKDDNVSVFRFEAENKSQKMVLKDKDFKCDHCDYKCKKHSTLMNHKHLKHTVHTCKICSEEFKTPMELVSHVAKDHHEEEEVWNVKHQSTPKSDKETINSSFVFSESMPDDFL